MWFYLDTVINNVPIVLWLVVEALPSEKYEFVSWDDSSNSQSDWFFPRFSLSAWTFDDKA